MNFGIPTDIGVLCPPKIDPGSLCGTMEGTLSIVQRCRKVTDCWLRCHYVGF